MGALSPELVVKLLLQFYRFFLGAEGFMAIIYLNRIMEEVEGIVKFSPVSNYGKIASPQNLTLT